MRNPSPRFAGSSVYLRRRDPGHQRCGGAKCGVAHAQRLENLFAGELIEGLAAHAVDDFAQQLEIDVAIDETLTGRPGGLVDEHSSNASVVSGPSRIEVKIRRSPEKCVIRLRIVMALLPPWNSGRYVVTGSSILNLALLVQLHDRWGGGDHFRERSDVVDGVERSGLTRGNQRSRTVRLAMDDLAVVTDDDDRTGYQPVANGLFGRGIERSGAGETLRLTRPPQIIVAKVIASRNFMKVVSRCLRAALPDRGPFG